MPNILLREHTWQSIQVLRGIAVILIICFHTWEMLIAYAGEGGAGRLSDGFWRAGASGVDIFFIISGFIIVHSTRGKSQSVKSCRLFLQKRAIRIIPLYWIYSCFFLLLVLCPFTLKNTVFSLQHTILSFLLIPAINPVTGLDLPLLPQGWTLSYEVYFYLFFGILLTQKKQFILPSLTLFFVLSVCVGFFIETENPIIRVVLNPLLLEFVCGSYLAYKIYSISITSRFCYFMILTGGISLLLAGFFRLPVDYRVISYGIPCSLIILGLVCLEKNESVLFPQIFIKLGDSSYSIYLSHIFVILIFSTLLKRQIIPIYLTHTHIAVLTVFSCLFVGYCSYVLLEKKLYEIL
ncbi:acyltransferase [Desulfobulbus sp. US4]|nr:acyltransferase [Desulfobulbus sp. US4]